MHTRRSIIVSATAAVLAAVGLGVWWWHGVPAPAVSSNPQSPSSNPQYLPHHPVVKRIVKDGPAMPYLKFNYLIKELPTDLAAHDVSALLALITGTRPPSFAEGEWGSLTNDIQEALSVQETPSPEVARALILTFRDAGQSQMMRDYALQHIGGFAMFLVHTRDSRDGTLPPFFHDLVAELKSAIADDSKPWAGTAFNLLDGLLRSAESSGVRVAEISAAELTRIAIPVAANPQAPLNARLPALQLATRHRAPEALRLARAALADPSSPLMLVQASAAAIGQLGGKDDLPMLNVRLASATPHTRPALDQAIKSLTATSPLPAH